MPAKPRPHWGWLIRLSLIAASLCIVLFAISLRKTVIIGLSGYGLMLTDGGVWLIHRSDFQHREFATTDAGGHLDWWPPCGFLRSQVFVRPGWSIDARLWFLAAANLAAAGAFVGLSRLQVHRRHRAGRCPHCGFDLSATPAPQPCPECGHPR